MTTSAHPESRAIIEALRGGDGAAAGAALERAGFRHPDQAANHLTALASREAFARHSEEAVTAVLTSADPDMGLRGLVRYVDAHLDKLGQPFDFSPAQLSILLPVLGASGFLTNYLVLDPSAIDRLARSPWLDAEKPGEELQAELSVFSGDGGAIESLEALQSTLRRLRASEMFRIAVRELTGRADVDTVMRELTRLAEVTLERAVQSCEAELRRRYGVPMVETIGGEKVEGEFVVIGMGKLGAQELNFSSDVDLLYVYSSSRGQTSGGKGRENLGLHLYYVKLAELVTRAIGEVTADGFVFRVDLGLRPEGNQGQLANSLAASELYYSSWAETWERSALLRARPVAGNRRLGEDLLRILEPIVYRKTLDTTMVEDMRQMKQRIDNESRRRGSGAWNVKLGRGGIREIEFVVNSIQLVRAGREPSLRVTETLRALERLHESGYLNAQEARQLSTAYRFFRTLEHKLQMAEDRQTHSLPTREEDLDRVIRAMGFREEGRKASRQAFEAQLHEHRSQVRAAFDRVLAQQEPDGTEEVVEPELSELLEADLSPEEERRRLAALGFEDPKSAAARLVWLRETPPSAGLSLRSRRLLRTRAPVFLREILKSPDPDRALAHLETFFSSTQARYTLFTVLDAHRETLRLLIRLFGTSDYLSNAFIQHPELLDSLVLSSYATVKKSRDGMREDLNDALLESKHFEDQLNALRRFKRGEVLRIAFNDLSGTLGRPEVSRQLSDLAETCLGAALKIGQDEMDDRFGTPVNPAEPGARARFALLAMGKLGGREINYHSDLDVIFVYDPPGETTGGSRGRSISNSEYFVKLGQRIISIMSLPTAEGALYEVDTRLRPSGNAGALVTSREGFDWYHEQSAHIWERQALIKARFIGGDVSLGRELERMTRHFAYERPWKDANLREIAHVRERMEKEIAREKPGRYNLKTGRGGLVDVEFIVQALQLRHAAGHEECQVPNTLSALAALRDEGRLDEETARHLDEGYRFLRTLEDLLRLLHDSSTSALETSGPDLEKLARRLGYESRNGKSAGAALLEEYRERTERIRGIYESIFGRGPAPVA